MTGDLVYSGTFVNNAHATERRSYVQQSEGFVGLHAERLGVTPADILDAICRGWDAERIAALLPSQARYLSRPPIAFILSAAPVKPVVRDTKRDGKRREAYIMKPTWKGTRPT
jgi:hypothetical protein